MMSGVRVIAKYIIVLILNPLPHPPSMSSRYALWHSLTKQKRDALLAEWEKQEHDKQQRILEALERKKSGKKTGQSLLAQKRARAAAADAVAADAAAEAAAEAEAEAAAAIGGNGGGGVGGESAVVNGGLRASMRRARGGPVSEGGSSAGGGGGGTGAGAGAGGTALQAAAAAEEKAAEKARVKADKEKEKWAEYDATFEKRWAVLHSTDPKFRQCELCGVRHHKRLR
jgi:hypothetical protein